MKIGMFTSGYMRNSLEDAFRDAQRFGYDGIEIWGGRPHAFAPDLKRTSAREIIRLSNHYDIPIIGYTPEMNAYPYNMMIGDERMRRESLDYVKLSMDMAKEMGAGFTLISAAHAGYSATKEEIWERLLMNMEELVAYADQLNHKLVFEALTPYESNVITSANDLEELFRHFSSENLVGMCDVIPPFVQGEPIMSYFQKLGKKMEHIHLVDSDGNSDTHVIPGEGVVPLREMLFELKTMEYCGYMTIELVTAYLNEPSLYAKRAIDHIRGLLSEI